jgi:hypothetical protein
MIASEEGSGPLINGWPRRIPTAIGVSVFFSAALIDSEEAAKVVARKLRRFIAQITRLFD